MLKLWSLTAFLLLSVSGFVQAGEAKKSSKGERHEKAIAGAQRLFIEENTFDASVQKNWPEALLALSGLLKPEGSKLAWDFEQFRYLKLLKRPIATSGRLDVTLDGDDITVNWLVNKPVLSEFRVEDGKVKQRKDGKWKGLRSAEQPAFVFVSKVMNQALLGDFTALSEHFNIYFLPNNDTWSIGLMPKDESSQLADMIHYILLSGQSFTTEQGASAQLTQVMIMDARDEPSLIELRVAQSL